MKSTLDKVLVRSTDVLLSSALLVVLSPSLCWSGLMAIVKKEPFVRYIVRRDLALRSHKLVTLARSGEFTQHVLNIFLGRSSFCGIALADAQQDNITQAEAVHLPRSIKPGYFTVHGVRAKTGLVDTPNVDNRAVDNRAVDAQGDSMTLAPTTFAGYLALLGKGIFSYAVYRNHQLAADPTFTLHGIRIDNQTMQSAVDWATTSSEAVKTGVFVNAHSVNTSFDVEGLAENINSADRVFADGSGVRLAAKRLGVALKDNVNGTDMLPPLCASAEAKGLRIFLLGAKSGVALQAALALKEQFPGLQIAGVHHGYFNKQGDESDRVIEKVNHANTDILLVAAGSPIQEAWIEASRDKLQISTALAVGGLFDFFSGNIKRAPMFMRELGMEWVWRIVQEPAAKWKRYIVGNPRFMLRLYFAANRSALTLAPTDRPVGIGIPVFLQQLAVILSLIVIAPALAAVALAIKLESRGPALFTQTRVGENGKRFKLYKFRSMYMKDDPRYVEPDASQSDRDGVCMKFFDDPRITRIGKFIRKYSIDELPQLLNVAKGEMVLIGPRPALPQEVDAYQLGMYRRLDSKPGLTGLWQVSGRANTTFEEQIALDVSYVDQRSLLMDVRILLATVPAVLKGEGAY